MKRYLSLAAAAVLLCGAAGPVAAAENCFRFYNEHARIPVLHVSFDSDPLACPTGTCWQADVPRGEMREYCPGAWVYPPPQPKPFMAKEFRLVFSRNGELWMDQHGLLNNPTTFLCEIVAQDRPWTFRGCGPLNLRDKPW